MRTFKLYCIDVQIQHRWMSGAGFKPAQTHWKLMLVQCFAEVKPKGDKNGEEAQDDLLSFPQIIHQNNIKLVYSSTK